jgi:2-keto-4-pentenoate hydratase/2-oxohepta-3-ene-1,7-dioic acid hydratase in catechol pathway
MRIALLGDPESTRPGPEETRRGTYARLDGPRAMLFDGAPWLGGRETGASRGWSEGDLLCPVRPSKIVCIGRNYAAHARELGHEVPSEPLLFLKPPSALLAPGGAVVLPPESARVEHEAELVVVVGRRTRNVAREDALAHVFGYTGACDVTARDLQRKDVQFTRAKGFDTFCPIGPWVETDLDPGDLAVRCRVSGATRQDGTTKHMIFDVPTLVSYVSRMMTLEPGDVILTGTPEGVGPLVAGDSLEVEVSGIGVLKLVVQT